MKIDDIQKKFIEDEFWDNPMPDIKCFNMLKTSEELDYLLEMVNWDDGMTVLRWIAQCPLCSKATALKIFWRAQPQEFTKYSFNQQAGEEQEIFELIKTVYNNYQNNFYLEADIHYDPKTDMEEEEEMPSFMKQGTNGEEWYLYYEEEEVKDLFDNELERKYKAADSAMELFNLAYYCRNPENAELILNLPLCDKGTAVMLFWHLKTFAGYYTRTKDILKEIETRIKNHSYNEVIAYNYKSDSKISCIKKSENKWVIPKNMKQPI